MTTAEQCSGPVIGKPPHCGDPGCYKEHTMNSDNVSVTNVVPENYGERAHRIRQIDDHEELWSLHAQMQAITERLLTVWLAKVLGYGTARYDEHDLTFDAWMNFSDVYRKMIRLEELTREAAEGDTDAVNGLIEIYGDMANYAMSAILILQRHVPTPEEDN